MEKITKQMQRWSSEFGKEYTDRNPHTYRGNKNLLWKANFARLYIEQFKDLELVKEKRIKYLDNDNVDSMFLIRKKTTK